MDTLRFALAVMLTAAVPAALLFWFLIHPLVRLWRRLGAGLSYTLLCTILAAVMAGMFLLRHRLLAVDWGLNPLLAGLGLICLALSAWLKMRLSKELTVRILVGIPELSPRQNGTMLQTGLYARMRHPRYLQMDVALTGVALIANYPAVYVALLVWFIGIYLVALLEERELLERFGDAYRRYCDQVPRFVPRWWRN